MNHSPYIHIRAEIINRNQSINFIQKNIKIIVPFDNQILSISIQQLKIFNFSPNIQINFKIMFNDHNQQNLYEIPNCSICLTELTENLASLACGHVYHNNCITQNFSFRGTCPNCQKRSQRGEIRPVVFSLIKSTQSAMMMRQILGELSNQQKSQVQELFKKVNSANQKSEKLEYQLNQAEKDLKKVKKQLDETKTQYNISKSDLQTAKKNSLQLKKAIEYFTVEIKKQESENFDLNVKLQQYQEKDAQYEKVKLYKRKMNQNSKHLIIYKEQLEAKQTPPQQIANTFFNMIMAKNLQFSKLKNQNAALPQLINQKQEEISQLRQKLDKEKKEFRELLEKEKTSKKKYEQLKVKYRNLFEKYKSKCQQILSDDDNYEDSMLSRPSFPLFNNGNSKNTGNLPNLIREENISIAENKPLIRNSILFNSIMEVEQRRESQKSIQIQKRPVQQSLNSFVLPKSTNPFGSFGGIAHKKKPEEKKSSMKNIFN